MKPNSIDVWHMTSALTLARTGLGRVAPNPAVGCVIVKDGHVVGRARTADDGRPHAETQALAQAGKKAQGASVYVTLEPCAHHGQTGPCAQALIDAGIAKVVIALEDTDPRVRGKGIEMLRDAGVEVLVGILEEKAREMNQGFFLRHSEERPLISLKTATTLDAKTATRSGDSKWITGELARRRAHLIRSQHDAIAAGVNTVLADDPQLTVRLDGLTQPIVRVIFDTHLRLRGSEQIFKDVSENPLWIIASDAADPVQAQKLGDLGAKVIRVPIQDDGHADIMTAMHQICTRGVTRLLVEGGAGLMTGFLKLNLFDRLYWFRSGAVFGADGYSAAQMMGVEKVNQKIDLQHCESMILGEDMLDIYRRGR